MMFTQKIYLAFLLIFLVQSTRIKNGLRFKDLQEKLTVDELESIKYMVQFGKINNIVDLIKKKEGNITISELAEIKGIKKEDIKYIWNKYYHNEKKHKRNAVGTGLGLSIVKTILDSHNFKYGVDSKINKGTTFYFEINKTNKNTKSMI